MKISTYFSVIVLLTLPSITFASEAEKKPITMMSQAAEGYLGLLKQYLQVRGDPNAKNSDGINLLTQAVQANALGAVELLLEKGANPSAPNDNGFSPLYVANAIGNRDIQKAIRTAQALADLEEEFPSRPSEILED